MGDPLENFVREAMDRGMTRDDALREAIRDQILALGTRWAVNEIFRLRAELSEARRMLGRLEE